MAKLTLTDLANLQNGTTAANAINSNNTLIEDAVENTLSRDGSSPNRMGAALDMDSNAILNLPAPTSLTEPLRLQDLEDFTGGGTITINGAPTSATYVTLSTDGTLSAERVLTAGDGIDLTDAGAGSTITISLDGELPDSVGVGTAVDAHVGVLIGNSLTGGSQAAGIDIGSTFTSPGGTITPLYGMLSVPAMAAGSTTITNFMNIRAGTLTVGAGNTVTNAYGLYLDAQTVGGTKNRSMYAAGTVEVAAPILLGNTATSIAQAAIANTTISANEYTTIFDPTGTKTLWMGGSVPYNIHSNTHHLFQSRDTLTLFAEINSGGMGLPGVIVACENTAIPAGGTASTGYMFSSTSNFGIFFGSGAPSLSAAKGSLYLRSDGSGTTNRAYINTDGSTTWTALTTAA